MLKRQDSRNAVIALVTMALLGTTLIFLFPGSPELDTDYHFLEARTAWLQPAFFVDVWGRPLYITLFAPVTLLGLTAARLFAVGLGVVTAWQTWRLAGDLDLERPWLVVPLLLGQPVFFELFPDLLTEPLFALVFVVALRYHMRGWTRCGMFVASFLPLARPEGVFVCALWGIWALAGNASSPAASTCGPVPFPPPLVRRLPSLLILVTGSLCWWIAATCITRDPLFILHDWPVTWHQDVYGRGTFFSYGWRAGEFTGPLLMVPFVFGLWRSIGSRSWLPITTSFLSVFLLHSFFRAYGLFGEAGYPRYMVSVAPVIAVLSLDGWNAIARPIRRWSPAVSGVLGWTVLTASLIHSFLFLASAPATRDPVAIGEMAGWLRTHPQPWKRLIWSHARMCIVSGSNLKESPPLRSADRQSTMAEFQNAPAGTLVFWDDHVGPAWFGVNATDIETSGYRRLRTRRYSRPGVLPLDIFGKRSNVRELELTLLFKP
ncbi:MAG: hypothetical protein JO069_10555 [Verrucomicrobia bacterium]|nr:hypothetical protein [Verrucomicrobiota bacterium]